MIAWLLTVVTLAGDPVYVRPFPTSGMCADAMYKWAEIEGVDARCHKVVHEIGEPA